MNERSVAKSADILARIDTRKKVPDSEVQAAMERLHIPIPHADYEKEGALELEMNGHTISISYGKNLTPPLKNSMLITRFFSQSTDSRVTYLHWYRDTRLFSIPPSDLIRKPDKSACPILKTNTSTYRAI
jgi:hypothetical protein